MSDENFVVELRPGVFFVEIHNSIELVTTDSRQKAAKLSRRLAEQYVTRFRVRGFRQAAVVSAGLGDSAAAADEQARIARFWGQQ